MTPFLLRLLERRLARRVPANRLAPLLGDLLEDYHEERAVRPGWRGRLAAQLWLARECLSLSSAYRALPPDAQAARHVRPDRHVPADQRPVRQPRTLVLLDDLRQDARDALRTFVRHPGMTAVAILTLMLGIGANAAIFTVVHGILLRPLPYKDSDRLVELVGRRPVPGDRTLWQHGPAFDLGTLALFRTHTRTLSHIGVHDRTTMTLTPGGGREALQLVGHRVSASFLPMLGVAPRMGRFFTPHEEQSGEDAVVILSYAAWQREFGGDPQIVGRLVSLGDRKHTVIGVMDRGFQFPDSLTQFWVPFVLPTGGREARARMTVTARLADGVSTEAAAAELAAILSRLPSPAAGGPRPEPGAGASPARARAIEPAFVPGPSDFQVVRVHDRLVAPIKPALIVLAAAVAVVLLIACVNVANLLLVNAAARQREMAVRLALGAGRGRLLRQTLTESVMLALIGGAAGTALALGAVPLLRALGTSLPRPDLQSGVNIPRLEDVGIDTSVLAFTVTLSILTGILFGIAPALRRLRAPLLDALRTGHASTPLAGGHLGRGPRLQGLLVIAEIAMAMTLFIGGGLLIHSFVKLSRVDPGYDVTHVLTFRPSLETTRDPIERLAAFEAFTARLRAIPGIVEAGYTGTLPTMQDRGFVPLRRTSAPSPPANAPGSSPSSGPPPDRASPRYVSQHYLRAMGVTVVAGRGFTDQDRAGQPPVVLINESVVRSGLLGSDPNLNPIGMSVYAIGRQPWTVVGVVKDVRQLGLDLPPVPEFFIDFRQIPGYPFADSGPYFTVRTAGPPTAMVSTIRGVMREMDPHALLTSIDSMDAIVSNSVSRPRLYAVLVGIFAMVALTLAAVGIYGVMAFVVSQRTHEMGIRMALGARPHAVMGLVLRQSAVLIAIGLLIGLAGAVAASRTLEGLLFGLTPFDVPTFAAASLLFAAVAALASWIPARRATRIEPVIALRGE
jgi:putative ABC transport system permease protein